MASLSNFPHPGDATGARPAQANEIDEALGVLLAGPDIPATADQLQGFLSLSSQRGLDLSEVWVAVRGHRVRWAMLPVVSPGRTMLLLSPPRLGRDHATEPVAAVIEAACEFHRQQGMQLAQLLIDPEQASLREAYRDLGFIELAELIYLQRTLKNVPPLPPFPFNRRIRTYNSANHDVFLRTIARSYENSLDCPGLNGLRQMEDVLAGHKGSGDFDPSIWFLLVENDVPSGVLLMGKVSHADALELVYLGLVPEARGRGLGDVLLRLALLCAERQGRMELTLAVDSRNAPAMKLYFRHGLRKIGSRTALIRNLEPLDAPKL